MDELLRQGLNIMLYGMGMVFCFLSLLVICITGTSSVIHRWFPQPTEPTTPRKRQKAPVHNTIAPKTLAILQAAVDHHRQTNT